jgi:uncharacterized protein (TIGR04255 family)
VSSKVRLPEYDKPPVIEVVCGVLFQELNGLLAAHVGKLWEKFQPEYVKVRETSPLAPAIEILGEVSAAQIRLTDIPPLARTWFMTESENGIVQIQRDRFIHNWKRVGPKDEYPRYTNVIEMFQQHLATFQEFVDEFELGTVKPIQYEMTYVNHIPQGEGWNSLHDVGDMFPDFGHRSDNDRFLPMPDQLNWRTSFLLPKKEGRLHTVVRHIHPTVDEKQLLLFELTARGIPRDDGINAMRAWFEMAHEWIVRGFTDLTSESVRREVWRQTR